MTTSLTSPEEEGADTEERILAAAHRVFLRRGTAGARTQEIADEAGVNKALLHYYFRSKERLAEAVFLRAAGAFFPRLLKALVADLPLEEKVRRLVDIELSFLQDNPYLPGYILSEFQYHPEQQRERLRKVLASLPQGRVPVEALQRQLDQEAAAGRMRPMQALDFVLSLVALLVFPFAAAPMLEVMVGLDRQGFEALTERRRREVADFFLRAIRPG